MKIASYIVLVCSLSAACVGQGTPLTPEEKNRILGRACTEVGVQLQTELHQCQAELQKWKAWGAENVPKHDALLRDFEELKRQKTFGFYTAAITITLLSIGIGIGVGLLNKFVKYWKRLTPSREKKQLTALIVCALWIAVTGVFLVADSTLSQHPVNLLITLFIYSLPAILFGSIMLWWLKRAKSHFA